MRRSLGGRFRPSSLSKNVRSASRTYPASGRSTPASADKSVVLPDPDGPNSTFRPGPKSTTTSSEKLASAEVRRSATRARKCESEAIVFVSGEVACADQHEHRKCRHDQTQ